MRLKPYTPPKVCEYPLPITHEMEQAEWCIEMNDRMSFLEEKIDRIIQQLDDLLARSTGDEA
jgi:hypothetical protein